MPRIRTSASADTVHMPSRARTLARNTSLSVVQLMVPRDQARSPSMVTVSMVLLMVLSRATLLATSLDEFRQARRTDGAGMAVAEGLPISILLRRLLPARHLDMAIPATALPTEVPRSTTRISADVRAGLAGGVGAGLPRCALVRSSHTLLRVCETGGGV